MGVGLLELGEIMLATSSRRLEIVSLNVANVTTPGFKRGLAFEDVLAQRGAAPPLSISSDFTQGGLRITGRPFDIALSGQGFLQLRSEDGIYYARGGQFERMPDGRIANAQGFVLQTASGDDLIVSNANAEILDDGVVLEDGAPVARLGLFQTLEDEALEAIGGSLFRASDSAMQEAAPLVRQGALENSNVDMASEMIGMMSAVRQGEIGARVVQAYDSLIGQSISIFGRTTR